jgi:hypothetical protein
MRCCACRASPACRPPSTKIGIRSGTPCRPADFASRSSIVGIARWDWPPANDCAPFICRPMRNLDRCARLRCSDASSWTRICPPAQCPAKTDPSSVWGHFFSAIYQRATWTQELPFRSAEEMAMSKADCRKKQLAFLTLATWYS